jgi:hypothetical protein
MEEIINEPKLTYKQRKNNYIKKWREEHKEQVKEYCKKYITKYYDENREKILQQKREYYQRKKALRNNKIEIENETNSNNINQDTLGKLI